MSEDPSFRDFVTQRLASSAEEVRALCERIEELEEQLRQSQEENHRKQRLLDQILSPRVELVRARVQVPPSSPGPGLDQKVTQTERIKEEAEELSIKEEQEQLSLSFPESSAVCVKKEEVSPLHESTGVCVKKEEVSSLQRRPTEHRELSSEMDGDTEHSSDPGDSEDWELGTKAEGLHQNQVREADGSDKAPLLIQWAPVTDEETSGADEEAEAKKHQCYVCQKRFRCKRDLTRHIRVHTGEKPYACALCLKTFSQRSTLNAHKRTHTGEKPHSCQTCHKTFTERSHLIKHERTHTGERPYSCLICHKTFTQKSNLTMHQVTHTGEKPYQCPVCNESFSQLSTLKYHGRIHTGEKPFSCSFCDKSFARSSILQKHMRTHSS